MNEGPDERTVTRVGTARALVLLGAAISGGVALLACLAALLLGPAMHGRPRVAASLATGGVVFLVVVVVFAILASVLAARGRTVGAVVGRGCGLLLTGMVVGLAAVLLLISRSG